jgi:hypothetical protein
MIKIARAFSSARHFYSGKFIQRGWDTHEMDLRDCYSVRAVRAVLCTVLVREGDNREAGRCAIFDTER